MITAVLAEAEEAVNELAIPAVGFGILAFTALMALLFVTFAFRSVGTRR
jgi:hypothetical protein